MKIDAPLRADVRHVAENMRQKDIVEFRAISRAESVGDLVETLVARYGDRGDTICARLDDGTPVAIGAMIESGSGSDSMSRSPRSECTRRVKNSLIFWPVTTPP